MRRYFFSFLISFFLLGTSTAQSDQGPAAISWRPWGEEVFAQAKRENRFVLLDLEAVWCHWCHVMDRKTYGDPQVQKIIHSHFLPVKVDQDSRPDLANRYEKYAWPATVIFSPEGEEIVKRRGFIAPEEMTELLHAVLKDPKSAKNFSEEQVEEFSASPFLSPKVKVTLEEDHAKAFDPELGGLQLAVKFLDSDSVEYAMLLARSGNREEMNRAKQTLQAAQALLDPVWGGVYQYSHGGGWTHPHFEKIMEFQTKNTMSYAQGYALFKDPTYLQVAEKIADYLLNFLQSPEGAFYTSQDADLIPGEKAGDYFALDDAARRQKGIPRIDKNIYSRENGWAITALVELYKVSGKQKYLQEALRAAHWILKNRSLVQNPYQVVQSIGFRGRSPLGGFRHGEKDAAGPFLNDTLAMGQGFLALYVATGDPIWLWRANHSALFIDGTFRGSGEKNLPGFITAAQTMGLTPVVNVDENISLTRFTNLLYRYTGQGKFKEMAEHAMRYLATEEIAMGRFTEPGILLADFELSHEPTHITVVGSKRDAQAQALFREALSYPGGYNRVEIWDKSEGPLPYLDVKYPELRQSAAFVCTNKTCSRPIYQAAELHSTVDRLSEPLSARNL